DLTGIGVDKNKTPVKDTDDADVAPDQKPAIELKKLQHLEDSNGDGDADAGEKVSYEFVGANTGNVTLHNIKLSDQKLTDAGVQIHAPADFTATLAPGESVTYASGTYKVTEAEAATGLVKNSADITGTPGTGPDVTDEDAVELPSAPTPAPVKQITPNKPATILAGFAPAGEGDTTMQTGMGIGAGVLAVLGALFGIKAWRSRKPLAATSDAPSEQ
ncbi:hypothetical protein ACFUOZ_20990, partial [Paenarthrobacter sp. NPDC057355]